MKEHPSITEFWRESDRFLTEFLERWRMAAEEAEATCPDTDAAKIARKIYEDHRALCLRWRRVIPFAPPQDARVDWGLVREVFECGMSIGMLCEIFELDPRDLVARANFENWKLNAKDVVDYIASGEEREHYAKSV